MKNQNPPCNPAPVRLRRTAYGAYPIGSAPRHSVKSFCSGPTQVDQSQRDECDINNIILRYKTTGTLPVRLNHREPQFLDVSEIGDLQQALDQVNHARDIIEALRAEANARANSSETPLDETPAPTPPPAA